MYRFVQNRKRIGRNKVNTESNNQKTTKKTIFVYLLHMYVDENQN